MKNKFKQDTERQRRLETFEISFLRFNDEDVRRNLEGVVDTISKWTIEHKK